MSLTACPMCGRAVEPGWNEPCPHCGTAVEDSEQRWRDLDRVVALQKARPPAIALMFVGAVVLLAGLAFPTMFAVMLLTEGLPPPGDERDVMLVVMGIIAVTGIGALAIGGLVAAGGYQMFRLRSWTLAIIASVFGMVSTFGCCIFGVMGAPGLLALPVGIWAIIVLNDPVVRSAFADRSRGRKAARAPSFNDSDSHAGLP